MKEITNLNPREACEENNIRKLKKRNTFFLIFLIISTLFLHKADILLIYQNKAKTDAVSPDQCFSNSL